MTWLLSLMARAVSRAPIAMLVVIALGTAVLGALGSQQEVETDITEFSADSELSAVFDRIEDAFGARGGSVQVIVDAGSGGNVLSADGLAVADRVAEVVQETPEVATRLQGGVDGAADDGAADDDAAVFGYADAVLGQLEAFDLEPEELTDGFAAALVDDVLDGQQGAQLEGLLSDDLDESGEGARARGGLVIVDLAPDVGEGGAREAALALADALEAEDFGWYDADAFSFEILAEDIEEGLLEDLPVLLGVSFALIIVILSVLFRRASDVALGVLGLVLTIVWMQGFAVLLGPGYLEWTGPFNQIAVAVPVLLVGLGIDYSVHLNARYQEERRHRAPAAMASSTAVRTVGVALLLATITTVIGFLANLATPLPPIADFGAFAAAGIASAFVVMGLLVPSARTLLDRRKGVHAAGRRVGGSSETTQDRGLMAMLARVPARAPVVAIIAAVVLAAGAALAATDLDTSFSQDEFIPEDSPAAQLLDRQEELFGGDISEQTFALVDGSLEDVAVLSAMGEAEERLADVDDVVTAGGEADVQSPYSVLESLEQQIEAAQLQLSAQLQLFDDPEAGAEQLPLPDDLTVEDLPDALLDEADTADDGAGELDPDMPLTEVDLDELEARLPAGVGVEEALLGALPGAELVEELRAGFAAQLEEEGPDGVAPADLEELAALDPAELDQDVLSERGYPLDEVEEDTLELLDAAEELERLGWRDGELADDADVGGLYDLARELLDGEIEAVLSEDGDAGLMIVATQAGEERAVEVATDLRQSLEVLEGVGADIAVASEQLLINETLDELTDAQIGAIVISLGAALALLVLYYAVTAGRPMLGAVTMVPPLLAVPLILGSMRAVGLSFNALTATVASIAVGIGVPYGIHLTNRYLEQRRHGAEPASTIATTVRNTGAALVGSAVTTASAFGVLAMSNLEPIRQFGLVTSITILYALLAAIFVETSCLVLWDRYHRWRGRRPEAVTETVDEVSGDAVARQPVGPVHVTRPADGSL